MDHHCTHTMNGACLLVRQAQQMLSVLDQLQGRMQTLLVELAAMELGIVHEIARLQAWTPPKKKPTRPPPWWKKAPG